MTKLNLADLKISPDVAALNPNLLKPAKEPKTEARKDLEREIRESFARQFETVWQRCNGPALRKEFKFCEVRDWRNDYLHEPTRIIIELDGGVFNGGRHVRPQGFIEDCVKLNMATMHGYGVIRIPTGFATDNYLSQIIAFLQNAQEGQNQKQGLPVPGLA
jgi:very-short-patch-repair endonuclease